MKISTKKWFILGIIIVVVGDFITNWVLNIKILSWIWQNILSFQITLPLWALILLCFSGLFVFILIKLLIKPDWKQYTNDKIFDVNWEWEWSNNYVGYYLIYPRCPKCMTKLDINEVFGFYGDLLTCGHCGYKKDFDCDYDELKKKVLNEIDRRVKKEEYKEKIK